MKAYEHQSEIKFNTWRQCINGARKVFVYNIRHDDAWGLKFPIAKSEVNQILKEHEKKYQNRKEILENIHTDFRYVYVWNDELKNDEKKVGYDALINIGLPFWGELSNA